MKDHLTYSNDTAAMVAWLRANKPSRIDEDEDEDRLLFDKIPTHRAGSHTVSVIRTVTSQDEQDLLDMVAPGRFEILNSVAAGDYESLYTLDAPEQAKFDQGYPRTPIIIQDPDGNDVEVTPPAWPGVFA